MRPNVRSLAIAFTIGLLGWLAVETLQLTGELVFFAAFIVGAIAGMFTHRTSAIAGLVVGMLAAYPIALAGKLIVFPGDNWAIYLAMASGLAAAGFFVARLAGRERHSMPPNAPGPMPSSSDIAER